jgi:putative phosphoribosyl transferase
MPLLTERAFESREDAARQLALRLARYRGRNPLVLAIPRGAVPMGQIIADALEGELDVALVRKLTAPMDEELAIGAIDESGWAHLTDYAQEVGATPDYIEREKKRQLAVLLKRRATYTPGSHPIDPKGRVAIVIDDGMATGETMIAALHAVREKEPAHLVCAVPVAPPSSVHHVAPYADEMVCLMTPTSFGAVAQFYHRFAQVQDEEVIQTLRTARARRAHATSARNIHALFQSKMPEKAHGYCVAS